ncbi:proteophosphoglycan ppg4 [Diplodia corticola]|uniref:Proteophosphoglycan ppg4 n=1 Tax=Diplodia corticola TaxID=236234 RepID=A0A1J9RKM0_9PEZI|nr:proteophosphoglycan ppg4 [Diplodia corticola]OJD29071.1 proteophosphoglycan ppg4 [Diplodia corticola]
MLDPTDILNELEVKLAQKWADPDDDLSELEWYALQSMIQRRTQDASYPPIETLKTAKDQSRLSPLGDLDMPAWFEWRVAHPGRHSRTSLAETPKPAGPTVPRVTGHGLTTAATPSQSALESGRLGVSTSQTSKTITNGPAGTFTRVKREREAEAPESTPRKAARTDPLTSESAPISSPQTRPSSSGLQPNRSTSLAGGSKYKDPNGITVSPFAPRSRARDTSQLSTIATPSSSQATASSNPSATTVRSMENWIALFDDDFVNVKWKPRPLFPKR